MNRRFSPGPWWKGWGCSLRCGVCVVAFILWPGPSWAETEDAVHELPLSSSGMGSVTEEELVPSLESNRQPLGPDALILPQWTRDEQAAFDAGRPVNLGGGLWTADRYPLQPAPPWPTPVPPPLATAPGVLGWELMSRYGAAREWCVDPQGVIEARWRVRLDEHLAAHAREAIHPVRVWVLSAGQFLAEALDDETLHRASFGLDQPGVLAVVPASEPLAARLILPPALAAHSASWHLSVLGRIDPEATPARQFDQLILWLTLEAEPLPAVGARTAGSEMHAASGPGRITPSPTIGFQAWWWGAAALVLVATEVWRRRRRAVMPVVVEAPSVWLEEERPLRLGGPHSGGSGAVVEW